MKVKTETMLEDELIELIQDNNFIYAQDINTIEKLERNFKKQIEKLNNIELTENEFNNLLKELMTKNTIKTFNKLRNKHPLKRNNKTTYLELINLEDITKNSWQIVNQIKDNRNDWKNRYDVTILVNGLPMIQIELKRQSETIKEAFNQIKRYKQESMDSSLFSYVQLFIISNEYNTKYFANNNDLDFKFTFNWTDENNNKINKLSEFVKSFLTKKNLLEIFDRYMVKKGETINVLRSYQIHAIKKIIELTSKPNTNGYIWHATGSGKTLTSFKACEIMSQKQEIDKVLFVVDRLDLDDQTINEFREFSQFDKDVSKINSASQLIKNFKSNNREHKLIVVTIQKLNKVMNELEKQQLTSKRVVLVFDECQRSAYGQMMQKIKSGFNNANLIGFTGTPIFEDNPIEGYMTTEFIFGSLIHSYRLDNAIKDHNVLPFLVETYNTLKMPKNFEDETIEGNLDKEYILNSPKRIEMIAAFIIENHRKKTMGKYSSMLAVQGINEAMLYYDALQKIIKDQQSDIKVSTIFTYAPNQEFADEHIKNKLERVIQNHNQTFNTSFSLKDKDGFNTFRKNIANKVRSAELDILIVVNMFLVGFDAKLLNTLYVDKTLKYHRLIQAYSRTNRISDNKEFGRIVSFRNLKQATDIAVALYSSNQEDQAIILDSYQNYLSKFKNAYTNLAKIILDPSDVNDLDSKEQKEFINIFKSLNKNLKFLKAFSNFTFDDLPLDVNTFEAFKGVYKELFQKSKKDADKIKFDGIDFEIDSFTEDYIDLTYIKELLLMLENRKDDFTVAKTNAIEKVKNASVGKSLKDLLIKFINSINYQSVENLGMRELFKRFKFETEEKLINNLILQTGIDPIFLNEYRTEFFFSGKKSNKLLTKTLKPIKNISHKKELKELIESVFEEIKQIREL